MSGAQWNAVRRNDIDFIGIDAARAQLKPARDVPPTDKQGVLLLNKRDTRLCAGQVSNFKRSKDPRAGNATGSSSSSSTSACGRMITTAIVTVSEFCLHQ